MSRSVEIASVTSTGSITTSAFGSSAAASAWCSLRKPSTAGGRSSASERYGSGAMPMPPPTSRGLPTSRRKPLPSGPKTASSSPASSSARALVPGPIGSIRNASSRGGAKQRLIGRGNARPGASSMKNCPGIPRSSDPRATRRSAYGPIHSTSTTLRRSRFMPLLQRERRLRARLRNGLDGCARNRERGDAGHACDDRGFANRVPVASSVATLGGVDDEVDAAAAYECDDGFTFADVFDGDRRECERARRPFGCDELEAEGDEVARDRDDAELVVVADGEKGSTTGGERTAGSTLGL